MGLSFKTVSMLGGLKENFVVDPSLRIVEAFKLYSKCYMIKYKISTIHVINKTGRPISIIIAKKVFPLFNSWSREVIFFFF